LGKGAKTTKEEEKSELGWKKRISQEAGQVFPSRSDQRGGGDWGKLDRGELPSIQRKTRSENVCQLGNQREGGKKKEGELRIV